MDIYTTAMSAHGADIGIKFKFHGPLANTHDAHRTIQYFQEEKGPEVADKIVSSLYWQYFENEQHPSSDKTLMKAITDAGIPESEAKSFVDDKSEGLMDLKAAFQEQLHNGIDAVPSIIFEGKRRDLTLLGAKEVDEYLKAMQSIVKESK